MTLIVQTELQIIQIMNSNKSLHTVESDSDQGVISKQKVKKHLPPAFLEEITSEEPQQIRIERYQSPCTSMFQSIQNSQAAQYMRINSKPSYTYKKGRFLYNKRNEVIKELKMPQPQSLPSKIQQPCLDHHHNSAEDKASINNQATKPVQGPVKMRLNRETDSIVFLTQNNSIYEFDTGNKMNEGQQQRANLMDNRQVEVSYPREEGEVESNVRTQSSSKQRIFEKDSIKQSPEEIIPKEESEIIFKKDSKQLLALKQQYEKTKRHLQYLFKDYYQEIVEDPSQETKIEAKEEDGSKQEL